MLLEMNNNWKLNQTQQYEDPYTNEVCDSLFQILTTKDKVKLEDFSTELPIAKVLTAPKDSTIAARVEFRFCISRAILR